MKNQLLIKNFRYLFISSVFCLLSNTLFSQNYFFDSCESIDTVFGPTITDLNCTVYEAIKMDGTLQNATSETVVNACGADTLPTVWYKIEVDDNAIFLHTSLATIGNWKPVWAIYSGNCGALQLVNGNGLSDNFPCSNSDKNDFIHTIKVMENVKTYYIAVSGSGVLDNPEFSLKFWSSGDCISCVGTPGCASTAEWTIKERSSNKSLNDPSFYQGEAVVVCVDFLYDTLSTSVDWLHGLIPDFGPGWDMNKFNPKNIEFSPEGAEWFDENDLNCSALTTEALPFLCTYQDPLTGKLTLCNTQCQSCPCNGPLQQGSKLPSGWFWNTNGGAFCDNDCSPSTQYGIGQVVSNIHFCTELHVKTFATQNEFETNKNLRFNFQTTTDGATGCWEDPVLECTRDYAQIGPDWVIDDSTDQTNTLALFVYEDVYKNGLYDNDDDFALKNCAITIVGSDTTFFTNSFGKVFLHLENGTYIIRYQMNYGDWENDVIEKTIIVSDLNQHDSLGFAPSVLNYSGNVIVGSNFLRCNTEVPIYVAASNTSNYTFDGYISLHIDPSLQINSGIPEPDFNSLNVLNWNFDNLRPGKSVYSKAFVNIPNQMTNADSLRFSGYLISSSGDTLSTFYYVSIIRCSYDPNDKRSWPDRIGNENYTLKSEKLDYTIRFQNNGNDTAYYVRIVDVLDNGVDKHSLFIKASSHQVETFMIGDTLNFVFDNIFLPDSTTNFRASQGYVSFSLSSKKDILPGSVITNKASIYFDKNLPIITNNVVNTIVDSLPCPLKNIWLEDNAIRVNPGGNSFKWYDCNTGLLVNTSLVAAYTPSFSGSYYAEIKGDHCTVRTECISFGLSSLDHDSQPMIKVYPNPTNGAFYISTSFKVLSVSAFDLLGNAVPLFTELGQANDSKVIFNNCIPGAYILAIQTSNRLYHTKVTIVK